jgi:regulator of RNase E activity RraB
MDIDFMIACPDTTSAESIAPLAAEAGYSVRISIDKEDGSITCYCMRTMPLDYDSLICCQSDLDQIGRQHGGYIDGWGTFGNGPKAK